jgi:glutaredoxin
MDTLERKILAAFDLPSLESLPALPNQPATPSHSRPRPLALSAYDDSVEGRRAVAQLVERGWLRPAESEGTFVRTEDGRLQLAGPRDVTIYSRPGCHLCGEAKQQIAPLLKEFGARITEINIDEDPDLRSRYDYDVPVILIGARKAAKHRVDLVQFRRQLRDAL